MASSPPVNQKRHSVIAVIAGLGLIFLAGILLILILGINLKPVEELLPEENGIRVQIQYPLDGASIPIDQQLTVHASASAGKPISRLVLWAGDSVVGAVENQEPSLSFDAQWDWSPPESGVYILTVRAYDQQGSAAVSDVVEIYTGQKGPETEYVIQPDAGQNLIEISEGLDLPPGLVAAVNPQIPYPELDLKGDEEVIVPVLGAPASGNPTIPFPDQVSNQPEIQVGFGKKIQLAVKSPGNSEPPPIPGLDAVVEGCDVRLSITSGSGGGKPLLYYVYRHSEGKKFQQIAVIEAPDNQEPFDYLDQNVYGDFIYYVMAVNISGYVPSDQVAAVSDDLESCFDLSRNVYHWSSIEIKLADPVDSLYCYVSQGDGPYVRFPHSLTGEEIFWEPDQNGVYQLAEEFPVFSVPEGETLTVHVKCLGWIGGALQEKFLTQISLDAGSVLDPVDLSGSGWSLNAEIGDIQPQLMAGPSSGPPPQLSSLVIPPPERFRRTLDPRLCAEHISPDDPDAEIENCRSAISNGDLVLVWEWIPTTCWPGPDGSDQNCKYFNEIDGYTISRVDGDGKYQEGGDIFDGRTTWVKGMIIPVGWPPLQGADPIRYVVRAYAVDTPEGNLASAPSNIYAVEEYRPDALDTILIEANYDDTFYDDRQYTNAKNCGTLAENKPGYQGAVVGQQSGRCGASSFEAVIGFDTSDLEGREVQNAVLRFERGSTNYSFPGVAINWEPSCADELGYYYTTSSDNSVYHFLKDLKRYYSNKSSFEIDVTRVFSDWTEHNQWEGFFELGPGPIGTTGNGISFYAASKDDEFFQCLSTYENFELEVSVFPEEW